MNVTCTVFEWLPKSPTKQIKKIALQMSNVLAHGCLENSIFHKYPSHLHNGAFMKCLLHLNFHLQNKSNPLLCRVREKESKYPMCCGAYKSLL